MRGIVLIVIAMAWLRPGIGAADDAQYDLGGPCADSRTPGAALQIRTAQRAGEWDRVVDLEKQNVRGGCGIADRWFGLANALVQAHHENEAIRVLAEMDSRGFDLSPSQIGAEHQALRQFMDAPAFRSSPVGAKVEAFRKLSDARRQRARALLAKLPADERPSEKYVAQGVCPFECCAYREWTVDQDTDLVAAPGSTQVVARVKKDAQVRGMTGEVHLQPEPVLVLQDNPFPKNSIVFVLDYEGEGFGHVWSGGKVISAFLGVQEYCFRVSDSCWGETLFPAGPRHPSVWWVKIRLPNGAIGWTDKTDHFGNKDACG